MTVPFSKIRAKRTNEFNKNKAAGRQKEDNMKHQELIERYIYAATRFMRKEEKEDVSKELQSIIADMLEERCGDEEPNEETVKEVLKELGDPRDLYEKYSADGKDCLIGAPYYGVYKYIMKAALLAVGIGLLIAQMIVCVIDMPAITAMTDIIHFIINMIMETLATVFDGVAITFAAVTIGFAIMYHKGIKMDTLFDSLDQLPQIPKKEEVISKAGIMVGMVIYVLFFSLFLACPEVLCMYEFETGGMIPIFQTDYIHNTWPLIVAFGLLGIGRECVKIKEGTYTKNLLFVTACVDVISAILAVVWLGNPAIINPAFNDAMRALFADTEPFIVETMANFNYFFLGCIIFALVIDLGTVAFKYYKAAK